MSRECSRCGATVAGDAVRYDRRVDGDVVDSFCSVNCLADTDHVDETQARDRIFPNRDEH